MKPVKYRSLKVPVEFDDFITDLAKETNRQTGMPVNKVATMRRMGIKLKGILIAKGFEFDMVLFGKRRRRI